MWAIQSKHIAISVVVVPVLVWAGQWPDAFDLASQNYFDWECKKLCESRDWVLGGQQGCCQFISPDNSTTGSSLCSYFLGKNKGEYTGQGYMAWECSHDERGAGKCAQKWGSMCDGSADDGSGGLPPIDVPPASPSPHDPQSYDMVWQDKFNGCGDLSNSPYWSFDDAQQKGRLQWYTTTQAHCYGGGLNITAEHKTPMSVGIPKDIKRGKYVAKDFHYISAQLTSQGKRTFTMGGCGKVEFRAKIDVRHGAFPAWWAMGDFTTPEGVQCKWPGCGEIDMMEYAGEHGWLKTNFCANRGGDASGSIGSGGECDWQNRITGVDENWSNEFHTWSMRWNEHKDLIEVSVDGAMYLRQTFSAADPQKTGRSYNPWRGKEHYMIINVAIGLVGGDPSGTHFPMTMLVSEVNYQTCKASHSIV